MEPDVAAAAGDPRTAPDDQTAAQVTPVVERRLRPPTLRVALTILAVLIVGAVFFAAAPAVKPFLLGIVLVYLMAPGVERLAGLGLPRPLAVLLLFALIIGFLIVGAALALRPLVDQVRDFADELPTILTDARASLDAIYEDLGLPAEVRAFLDTAIVGILGGLDELDFGAILAPLVNSLVTFVGTITAYIILPAWLFFVLKDRVRLRQSFDRSLPADWRPDATASLSIVNYVFGKWIRGQLLLGLVVGIASYVGLMFLSFTVDPVFGRFAVLLAIIAGVLELVPFIGPIIAAIPAVLIGMTAGLAGFLAALILYLLIQQLENNILVPKIQGDAVDLHPSLVVIALVVGASLGGVLGAILSLPVAAASRDLFRYFFRRLSDPPASVEEALRAISPRLVGLPTTAAKVGGEQSAADALPRGA